MCLCVQEVGKAWTFRGRCEEIQDDLGLHDCEGNKVDLYEHLKEAERWIQGSTPEQKERRRWAEDMFRGAARVAMADGNKAAFDVNSFPISRCKRAASLQNGNTRSCFKQARDSPWIPNISAPQIILSSPRDITRGCVGLLIQTPCPKTDIHTPFPRSTCVRWRGARVSG